MNVQVRWHWGRVTQELVENVVVAADERSMDAQVAAHRDLA